jgi:hypothetical protein
VPPEIGAAPPLAKLLVYAGKAHPELDAGTGSLAVSYATNSLEFAALFDERGRRELYWPRFWRVPAR